MRLQIRTHDLSLRPEVLSRIEQHLQNVFRRRASHLSGVTLQLTRERDSSREFIGRLQLHLRRSEDIVITDRDERLGALLKRATRRAATAVRRRLGRKQARRRRARHGGRPLTAV